MKITITRIGRKAEDKDGEPYKTQDGRPFTRLSIQVQEYGDKWLSGFTGFWNKDWKEGDEIDIEVEKKGEYLNIKQIDRVKLLEDRVAILEGVMKINGKADGTD